MSEGALLCVAPAVAAAVRDATGVVIRDLPLTPERVWRALSEPSARADPGPTTRRPDPMTYAYALDAAHSRRSPRPRRSSAARRRTSA